MKILSNSVWGLISHQKCFLYKSCILSIILYGFQIWFYNKALLSYPLKILRKIQRRAALWILGVFQTFLSFSIEAITGLILIYLHFKKLSSRSQLRAHALPNNHILWSLLKLRPNITSNPHCLFLGLLTKCQCNIIKDLVVNMDNRFNEVFPSFDPLNPQFTPGYRIINSFSSHFSFHFFNKYSDESLISCSHQLDEMIIVSSENPSYALVITNASIKNNVATSIAYVHICNRPVVKTLYHAVNVNSIKAELFVIKCSINQATNSTEILKIVVITDSIHAAKKIFDSSLHSFQTHSASILCEL